MLSYQHSYHAGNLADVHKHVLLSEMLAYMTLKDKPLSYIETHAGRGLYDLRDAAARKTGEAASGIETVLPRLDPQTPFVTALTHVRATHEATAYPGSPLIAEAFLRPGDKMHLAELHPGEYAALAQNLRPTGAMCHFRDGFEMVLSLCPPTPRRGIMLIDPSWEIKTDYAAVPRHVAHIARAWNVGVIALWYPILAAPMHLDMLDALSALPGTVLRHEVRFPPVRPGHGLIGSGMFILNPPYGLDTVAERLSRRFEDWFPNAG